MIAKHKGKGGRPPRAPGQPMTRLSVSIQRRHKDSLALIARDHNLSLSLAIEQVIDIATRIQGEATPSLESRREGETA